MGNTSFRLEVSMLRPNWSGETGWLEEMRKREEVPDSCKGVLLSLHWGFIQMHYLKQFPINKKESTALTVALILNFQVLN